MECFRGVKCFRGCLSRDRYATLTHVPEPSPPHTTAPADWQLRAEASTAAADLEEPSAAECVDTKEVARTRRVELQHGQGSRSTDCSDALDAWPSESSDATDVARSQTAELQQHDLDQGPRPKRGDAAAVQAELGAKALLTSARFRATVCKTASIASALRHWQEDTAPPIIEGFC